MTFLQLAELVLKEEKIALTSNEIWVLAKEKGYDIKLNSVGKTPWATLGAQIYVNTKDNPKSVFSQTDSRPKKFFLKTLEDQIDQLSIQKKSEDRKARTHRINFLEKDLHPYLTYYAYYHLNCYTKTINHSQSTKKEFGEWVHPDLVGCSFPFDDWKNEVYDLSASIGNVSIRLMSFELKRELSFGNLRESFFQTVSNSTWANESYLVAAIISDEEEFRNELSRLSTSFGIGIIKLNIDDPHSSEIIFPAKYRVEIDWETVNKLTMNSDYREFISTIKIDITSKKIHKKEYDQVFELESLKRLV
jgi:hypothetical protein